MTSINHVFNGSAHMGYGIFATKLDEAIRGLGVETHGEDVACDAGLWSMPPTHMRRYREMQMRYCFTMWEATNLPITFTENLHEYDTVFVPSKQNLEIFSEIHRDVRLVPLGVDPFEWHYIPRRAVTDRFNFLVCGAGTRKGIDVALEAFGKAFPSGQKYEIEPHLLVKSPVKCRERLPARTDVIEGIVSAGEITAIYRDAHCFLAPSRGEGWGMQPLQAMAQGIPTILSNAHGHAEFAHLGLPIPCGMSKAGMFLYGDAGTWWEPTLDALIENMRFVYEHYETQRLRAKHAAIAINETLTWKHTAQKVMGHIGRSEVGDLGEWVPSRGRRYLVRVDKPVNATIGQGSLKLQPGIDYYLPPDHRRVLMDAGFLDESCMVDQTGTLEMA